MKGFLYHKNKIILRGKLKKGKDFDISPLYYTWVFINQGIN